MAWEPPPNFICAACERLVDRTWDSRIGRNSHCPPICRSCERRYTVGVGTPRHGSFMDRRITMQIAALSECLRGVAGSQEWNARYGKA